MGQLWVMGCGDIGRRVASLYQNRGLSVIGWVSSEESLHLGQAQGIGMRQGNLDSRAMAAVKNASGQAADDASVNLPADLQATDFRDADVFWFMPPPRIGNQDSRLRHFLSVVQGAPRRIVLISTTGVYGDCQGRWIDESEPLRPVAERAKRRLDAESVLQAWGEQYDRDWVILRVPGIYAVDRLPLARLQRGEPVLAVEEAPWTNRIHADDLALICRLAMADASSASIYNATDGQPSTMTDYFNQIADFAGLPRPPQVSMAQAKNTMSAGMLSYLAESRRIRNDKLLRELRPELRYPSLQYGLDMKLSDGRTGCV